jgi:hypothetical protein
MSRELPIHRQRFAVVSLRRQVTMRVTLLSLVVAGTAALVGCFDQETVAPSPPPTVAVTPGLPASATNAVLHLKRVTPSDASSTNWTQILSGSRSLKRPVGSASDSTGRYDEDRLVAVQADGFVILFTKREGGKTQTNGVLFRFGRTTQTNTLGWRIVGDFR